MQREKEQTDVTNINSLIDFTLLDPRANFADIERVCDIAYKNEYYAVCINPCFVRYAKGYISKNFGSSPKIVTVVGFPLGANTTETKLTEARQALSDGADELDVVINIGMAKSLNYDYVLAELKKLRKISKGHILKAIIETCYFDENEIIKLSKLAVKAKVDFVKTSTGFGTAGANKDIVSLIYKTVGGSAMVKASGGIRTREQAIEFVRLGAKRIGTSSII